MEFPQSPAEIVPDHAVRGVTPRVVLLCLALAALFGYVDPIIDQRMQNTFLGAAHLPPGAIATLMVLLLIINPVMRLISKRAAFSRNETLTVYITCLFSCLAPSHGAENFFVPNLIAPFYFATRENKWLSFLNPYVKPWLSPARQYGPYDMTGGRAHDIVADWFTGLRPGHGIPWEAWVIPLAAWSIVVLSSYVMLGCLSVMLRAQWAEREALAFPLLRLPLELTEDVDRLDAYGTLGRFFRDKLMWTGFAVAVLIQFNNGMHVYYPVYVKEIPLILNFQPYLTDPPWNQLGYVRADIYLIVVGITYLLTSEVSFSLWFFYFFIKFQMVVAYYLGMVPSTLPNAIGSTAGAKTFTGFQQVGCYLCYVGMVLWTGREHFAHIARRAFGRAKAVPGEKEEALSYPAAFWGFVVSFAIIIAWSCAAGMRVDIALALWGLYLVIAIALTRVVVEGGLLFVQQGWEPLGTLAQLMNSGPGKWLAPASIVPGTFLQSSMITDLRAFIMPSFVQGFKLAHDRKIKARPLLALMAATTLVAFGTSLWMYVKMGYLNSGLTLDSWYARDGAEQPAINASQLMHGVTQGLGWSNWFWLAVGIGSTYLMMLARGRFLWFPFHPIGYLMCLTYPMTRLWFSIFLGWMFKIVITRFGGSEAYRKVVPAFLGLALGDVTMMIFWLIVDGWLKHMNHQLMPG